MDTEEKIDFKKVVRNFLVELIVLGASSLAFADLMMSKVTQQIINRAQSAVLVVK